jgi:hypothetical protein
MVKWGETYFLGERISRNEEIQEEGCEGRSVFEGFPKQSGGCSD